MRCIVIAGEKQRGVEREMESRVRVGLALCDLDTRDPSVDAWIDRLNAVTGMKVVELQPELGVGFVADERIRRLLADKVVVGVHQPCHGLDWLADGTELAERSFDKTVEAMALAETVWQIKGGEGRVYLVVHLVQQDNWSELQGAVDIEEARRQRVNRAIDKMHRLCEVYLYRGYGFKLAVEFELEYPKSPAGRGETVWVANELLRRGVDVGFVFDVAHWFHNRVSLLPARERPDGGWPEIMAKELMEFEEYFPDRVVAVHLAQAYVTAEGRHETHGMPGLWPDGNLDLFLQQDQMVIPDGFRGDWLDMGRVLEELRSVFGASGADLNVVLETIGYDLSAMTRGRRMVYNRLSQEK